jgi:hypothetical protein
MQEEYAYRETRSLAKHSTSFFSRKDGATGHTSAAVFDY